MGLNLKPLAAVLGPTAAGKSELAIDIAKRFRGEIVNFDSVQIYQGFDIGSAKVSQLERKGAPHHLIDIAQPSELFSAGDYAREARLKLRELRDRGALPVLVGGTGFYLRALLQGIFEGPERNESLRLRLERRAAAKQAGYLARLLKRIDPKAAERIHPNDQNKLVRALEVCLLERRPVSDLWGQSEQPLEGFQILRIGLDPPRTELYPRITRRSETIFAKGLIEEARGLLDRGVPRESRAFGSIGYKQALKVIDSQLSLEEAISETAKATRNYAKRQMTWFRREPNVFWLRGFGDDPSIQSKVAEWIAASTAAPEG